MLTLKNFINYNNHISPNQSFIHFTYSAFALLPPDPLGCLYPCLPSCPPSLSLKSPISYLTDPAPWGALFYFKFHNHLVLQKALCTEWMFAEGLCKERFQSWGCSCPVKVIFFFLPPLLQIDKDSHVIFLDLSSENKINTCPIYLYGYHVNVLFLPVPPSRLILL